MVLDDEDARPGFVVRGRGQPDRRGREGRRGPPAGLGRESAGRERGDGDRPHGRALGRQARELDGEPRAALGRLVHRDLAPVEAHQLAHDRQPEAGAAAIGRVDLDEGLEDSLAIRGRDPGPAVRDDDAHRGALGLDRDPDGSRVGREPEGVREEVRDDSLELGGVDLGGHVLARVDDERDPALEGDDFEQRGDAAHEGREFDGLVDRSERAGLEPRGRQQVLDQPELHARVPRGHLEVVPLEVRRSAASQHAVEHAEHERERRAQLVADVGDEASLEAVDLLKAVEQLAALVLGALALGHVLRDSEEVKRPALLVLDRHLLGVEQPRALEARVDRLLGNVFLLARGEDRAVLRREEVGLVPGKEVVVVLADHLGARDPEQVLARAVEPDEAELARILDEHHVRDVLEDGGEEAQGVARLVLAPLAGGHVERQGDDTRGLAPLVASQVGAHFPPPARDRDVGHDRLARQGALEGGGQPGDAREGRGGRLAHGGGDLDPERLEAASLGGGDDPASVDPHEHERGARDSGAKNGGSLVCVERVGQSRALLGSQLERQFERLAPGHGVAPDAGDVTSKCRPRHAGSRESARRLFRNL